MLRSTVNLLTRSVAVAVCGLVLVGVLLAVPASGADHRVVVLGIDGMDYDLTRQYMAEGRLPNFSKLAKEGVFQSLGTSVPPLSPVAWSDFITGMDGGGHGIFDFIHRNPETMLPYLSTSEPREQPMRIGPIPVPFMKETKMTLLRQGEAFWEVLEDHGIETTILRIPANFPVSGTATHELSGMGTPDILGTYGTFSFYTSELFAFAGQEIGGGEIYEVDAFDDLVEADLHGPKIDGEAVKVPFTVYIDPVDPVARFVIGDSTELILEVGEWSDWTEVEFDLGMGKLHGICRFYLRSVRPEFELYVTPINHDPKDPYERISTPKDFAEELAEATGGDFYTQGMPEDTRALDEGVFTREEFLHQASLSGEEIMAQLPWVFETFDEGLLFYYFGDLDQVSHLMFRTLDPGHPAYDPERDAPFADVIPKLYERMDTMLGWVLRHLEPGTKLIVMSDHGFTSWRRSFHLNTWLADNGYLTLKDPSKRGESQIFDIDWSKTRAYGLGFNGLYVNLKGRERDGIVDPAERDALLKEIGDKLLAVVDPQTEAPAITRIYFRDEWFQDGGYREIGPDLLVGYTKGTRAADESALGGVTNVWFTDNDREWSGDHSMDHTTVPGVLFANAPLARPVASLRDLSPAIVAEFGIEWNPGSGK